MADISVTADAHVYQCKSCERELGANDFYVSNQSLCKECVKTAVRKNRAKNIEYYRSYDRMRYREDDKRKARCRAMGKTTPMAVRVQKQRERRDADGRIKSNARQAVARAVAKGQIKKHTNCFFCGTDEKLQAHHPDHTKPLDVFWLCSSCHGKVATITGELHRDAP